MKQLSLAIVTLFLMGSLNAQITVAIQAGINGKQSHIDNLHPANNMGNYPLVNAGYNTVGGVPTLSRDFLQFDLSAIPTGATVVSAYLSLYHASGYNSSNTSGNSEMFALALNPWVQDSISWNYQPALSPTDTIYIGQTATNTDSKLNIDITKFARKWAAYPNGNFGMAMLLADEQNTALGNFQIYGSCYNADSTLRPLLVITYQAACPEQSVMQPAINGKAEHIDNNHTTTNLGNYPLVNAGYNTVGGTPTLSRNFIQFDLSAIPPSASIDSAYFALYSDAAYTSSNASGNTEMLALVQQPWVQDSITWNYQPTISSTDTIITGVTNTPTDSKPHIDLTKFVRYWVSNPNQNFGMAMLLADEQGTALHNFQIYGSCFDADSTLHPKLVVNWTYCATAINNIESPALACDVFPNPANNILSIRNTENTAVDVVVFDITGRRVMAAAQVKSIATAALIPGAYLLHIDNGSSTVVKKFIKE